MSTRAQNVSPIYLEPGHTVTCTATGAVTGCTFVKIDAAGSSLGNHPSVTPAGAGELAYGVAHYDAPKDAEVSIIREGTVGVTAGTGGLTAGDPVKADANGAAVTGTAGTDLILGICTADTAAAAAAPITLTL